MRIGIVHNYYQQRGGEDVVVEAEADLLRRRGHDVSLFVRNNSDFMRWSKWKQVQKWLTLSYARDSYTEMRDFIKKTRPDIVHCHNTFYMITPSVYKACMDEGVPVVQSMHNFRSGCANALFLRNNKACELCLNDNGVSAIRYKCYRNSRFLTWGIVRMNKDLRKHNVWQKQVNTFIATSEFAKSKLAQSGIPENKIYVKPNFISSEGQLPYSQRSGFLFVGRLSEEKGIRWLIKSWRGVSSLLTVAGDGPLIGEMKVLAQGLQVEFCGQCDQNQIRALMLKAKALIVPSLCYENFPRTIAEAYASGLPVIASQHGSLEELIIREETGLHVQPESAEDLQKAVQRLNEDAVFLEQCSRGALRYSNERLSEEKNYKQLMTIYQNCKD